VKFVSGFPLRQAERSPAKRRERTRKVLVFAGFAVTAFGGEKLGGGNGRDTNCTN
jgi:hypothetical protein